MFTCEEGGYVGGEEEEAELEDAVGGGQLGTVVGHHQQQHRYHRLHQHHHPDGVSEGFYLELSLFFTVNPKNILEQKETRRKYFKYQIFFILMLMKT